LRAAHPRPIETEYQRAVTDTEARWLSSVIDNIKSGQLSLNYGQIGPQAAQDYSQAIE
jgi:hypothetical protein